MTRRGWNACERLDRSAGLDHRRQKVWVTWVACLLGALKQEVVDLVVLVCNLGVREAETGGSEVQGHSQLQSLRFGLQGYRRSWW